MELQIELSELRKRSIFLATPCYGGMCTGIFTKSVAELSALCAQHGIQLATYFLFNESLVQRARNYCADEFVRSGATHMMFIDADIGFNAQDVITMLALQSDESEYDVLCGPYAKKCISWEKIKMAVDKGFADEDPSKLDSFVGDYVFNPANGTTTISMNEPAEILEGGTGFMMIRRKTFEKFAETHPGQFYKPDHIRTAAFDGSREIVAYFDCPIDPDSKRYLSEDYYFCQEVRKSGMKVWLLPWMKLQHSGTYIFGSGGLEAMASLGVSPTADPGMLKGMKK
jgi:hypothetical protein